MSEVTLYYHQTDGGAEYLTDTFIECPNGHKEGHVTFDTSICVRVDGGECEVQRWNELIPVAIHRPTEARV
jgi:hypothetical protein